MWHRSGPKNCHSDAPIFHEAIGAERKVARVRYLRNFWMDRPGQMPGSQILTSLGIAGQNMDVLSTKRRENYEILTIPIMRQDFQRIRAKPNVNITIGEIDTFCGAVEKLVRA